MSPPLAFRQTILASTVALGTMGCGLEQAVAKLEEDTAAVSADATEPDDTASTEDSTPAEDTGPTDTGPTDPGPTDTGPTDTGPTDTGPTDTGEAPLPACEANTITVTAADGRAHSFEGAVFREYRDSTWMHVFQTRGEHDPCDWGRDLEAAMGSMFTMEIVPDHSTGATLYPRRSAGSSGEYELKWIDAGAGRGASSEDGTSNGAVDRYSEGEEIVLTGISIEIEGGGGLSGQTITACYCDGMNSGD